MTTHSEVFLYKILPLMGSDQISANSSEGSVVIRGQYFGKALSPTQKIVVNLDGQNFDAKMTDQKGVFNAAIDMQKLLSSPSKQLTASIVDGNQKILSIASPL